MARSSDGGIEIGPIPAGTPVNLLANLELLAESEDLASKLAHEEKVLALLVKLKHDLKTLPAAPATTEATTASSPTWSSRCWS